MRKTAHRICVISFSLLTLFQLSISDAGALDVYGFGSYWSFDEGDDTWGGGGGVGLPLFTDYLLLDGRAYVFDDSDVDVNDNIQVIPLDLGLQIHFLPDQVVDPYVLGGASWIYVDTDRGDTDSDFGAYVGGGVNLRLAGVLKLFIEAVYRSAELDYERGSIDKDLDISGLTANAGLKLSF